MLRQSNKDYLLIGIVSFTLLLFEFLLSKELMFLYGMPTSSWVMPLVMLGFSLGSAINKISPVRMVFLYLVFMALSLFWLVKFPMGDFYKSDFNNILKFMSMLIWPFIVLGLYLGRVYFENKNLGMVFLSNGLGQL